MQSSQVIARLIGPLLAVIGIAMLTNSQTYRTIGDQFLTNYAVIYLSGIMVLAMGLGILNWHHHWTADWRSLITAIGWMFCLSGVWRILAPQFVVFVGNGILATSNFFIDAGIVLLALGGFLTFKGYAASETTS